ncbi:tetratricopeptide repeat protein [Rhodanobacter sp. A1T4]|jgi:predicted negative regulator of RcsB-dependent stress response|uniref:YfgM family protein n=1 Tax=Rhodanobacter sp. A1T4 TaxID=2723087 RepID=UPI001618AB17|nr:tetratricopeptide repeat protein [Rhodanobacter sp. A1T4]MBB6246609.1 putative negative regulator of RcsB-dependent stress response [Rhodanobacter sp. A1T4]
MAFDEYDKYEQSELVQKWLRENGLSIVVGIAIGLVGIFGWQQWRNHQARNESNAAQLYKLAQVSLAANKPEAASAITDQLMKDYEKSPYAVFAATDRAKQQVQAKQLDKAEASLDWAATHATDPALKSLTQLRKAQVELARDNGTAALATLDAIPANTYQGLAQELRGDVLVKLGRADDARKAYQAALSALKEQAPQRGALQMKLDDLAVAGKQGA